MSNEEIRKHEISNQQTSQIVNDQPLSDDDLKPVTGGTGHAESVHLPADSGCVPD
jgi:hypothetical protein